MQKISLFAPRQRRPKHLVDDGACVAFELGHRRPAVLGDLGIGVAGDLVFFGESNGLFSAADASTGKIKILSFDASKVPNAGGAKGSPAIYVVGGREYVVYGFGGNPGESPVLGDTVIASRFRKMSDSE